MEKRSVNLQLVGELCLKVVGIAIFVQYGSKLRVKNLLMVRAGLVELLP